MHLVNIPQFLQKKQFIKLQIVLYFSNGYLSKTIDNICTFLWPFRLHKRVSEKHFSFFFLFCINFNLYLLKNQRFEYLITPTFLFYFILIFKILFL